MALARLVFLDIPVDVPRWVLEGFRQRRLISGGERPTHGPSRATVMMCPAPWNAVAVAEVRRSFCRVRRLRGVLARRAKLRLERHERRRDRTDPAIAVGAELRDRARCGHDLPTYLVLELGQVALIMFLASSRMLWPNVWSAFG